MAIADTYEAGPTTYLERAYFNYFMNDYLVFTAGRLPTVDGPPLHWEDNVSREGTYSHLAYSNVLDGVATTVNLNKYMPQDHSLNFRFIYTPFSNVGTSIVAGGVLPSGNPGSIATKTGGKMDSISPLYVGMAEYSLKGQRFSDVLVLAQVLVGNNIFYGRSSTYGEIRVDYNTYSLYSHVTNLMNWGLDLSATAYMSTTKNDSVFTGLGGAYSSVKDVTKYGHAVLLTTRYAIPVAMLNNPSAGMEYIYGDKNFNKIDPVSRDVEGFYSTRGYGYHFYYSQPIETGLKLRFGYITKTDKYARGDVLGDVTDAKIRNNKTKNIYAQVRLDF
ncbi:MAG: hypothetical protein KBD76_09370 [Bacteriovorax sp.]|nr:hypothetical protein [Bacteriovorax sp.]